MCASSDWGPGSEHRERRVDGCARSALKPTEKIINQEASTQMNFHNRRFRPGNVHQIGIAARSACSGTKDPDASEPAGAAPPPTPQTLTPASLAAHHQPHHKHYLVWEG